MDVHLPVSVSPAGAARRAWILALVTVGYNFAEGAAALWLGQASESWGIFSFGVEAVVESLSGAVILWRFSPRLSPQESQRSAARERRAVVLLGWGFLLLAALIAGEAVERLMGHVVAQSHGLAFMLAGVSVMVKPLLFWAKWRLGRQLGSAALLADAKQTLACAGVSAALLLGILLREWIGVWQADPVLAILIAAVLAREGVHTLRHRHILCCPVDMQQTMP